jgi:hypothetical protein
LARIEQELQAEDEKRNNEARHKAQQIENAELRRHATVNDSQIVDEMFGFIDAQVDMTPDASAPVAFKVSYNEWFCWNTENNFTQYA